ncbi:MAG: hypothetical protein HQM10_22680 [Candidatus Riflebacteria bacterium]|nr:hypothetical protein [Candidatus Riflebacteria bacterium]
MESFPEIVSPGFNFSLEVNVILSDETASSSNFPIKDISEEFPKEVHSVFLSIEKEFLNSAIAQTKKFTQKDTADSLVRELNKVLLISLYAPLQNGITKLCSEYPENFLKKKHECQKFSIFPQLFADNIFFKLSDSDNNYFISNSEKKEFSLENLEAFSSSKEKLDPESYIFTMYIPLFNSEYSMLREPDGLEFPVLVNLPVSIDENLHSKIYSQILTRVEPFRELLQKHFQKADNALKDIWLKGDYQADNPSVKSQIDNLRKHVKQFKNDCIKEIDSAINSFSSSLKKVNGKAYSIGVKKNGSEFEKLINDFPVYIHIPGKDNNSIPNLKYAVERLNSIKIPDLYSDFRKLHTQSSGGIAASVSMLREIIKPERNSRDAYDLFSKKQIASFYQPSRKTLVEQNKKLIDAISESKNIIALLDLSSNSNGFEKLEKQKKLEIITNGIISEMNLFLKYCILYKQAIENILAIEKTTKKFFPKDESARYSDAPYKSVFNVITGIISAEMGDSKGNSPDYNKRMNLFQSRKFNDLKKQLSEIVNEL